MRTESKMPRDRHHFKILVVEDSSLINNALCDRLKHSHFPNFTVFSANSLEEARTILHNEAIDFIILDLELPDGTGEDLMEYMVLEKLTAHSKVIVLTGSIDRQRRENLFQLGIIDYLSKDNPINFLANEIKKSINHYHTHANTKILVVDDSKFFANYVATVLRNQNYSVSVCTQSTEVYQSLKNDPVNLLITDLEMPGMDGIQLLHHIRKDDSLLDLPIIGLSGTQNQDLITRLLKSGANDFLSKPFMVENLLLKVDITVALYKKQRKLNELNKFLEEEVKNKVEEIRGKDQILELDNRHAQMGQMIAALIHQWKQPLNGITLAAEYIDQITQENTEVNETLGMIKEQVLFLSDTMNHFRDFFKPAKELVNYSIRESCENILDLLGDTYHEIAISLEGDKNLYVRGYPNEFYQVIINLLNNAQDAFRERHVKESKIEIRVMESGSNAILELQDNAGGIPESIIHKIFDEYVSSKASGGTGIGLYLCRSVVQKIGGSIEVENKNGGACFIITLPRILDQE